MIIDISPSTTPITKFLDRLRGGGYDDQIQHTIPARRHHTRGIYMTLEPYNANKLDALAMRFLDLASTFRKMAQASRCEGLENINVHVTRPLEQLGRLEHWARDADAKLQVELIGLRAGRQAGELTSYDQKTTQKTSRRSTRKHN